MDWCLRVSLTGGKALQDLIINLLLNCQDDLKLSVTLLEPLRARLRKYINILLFQIILAYFYSAISFHDVKHSVLGVQSFIFSFQVSIDRVVSCSKWIGVWFPL